MARPVCHRSQSRSAPIHGSHSPPPPCLFHGGRPRRRRDGLPIVYSDCPPRPAFWVQGDIPGTMVRSLKYRWLPNHALECTPEGVPAATGRRRRTTHAVAEGILTAIPVRNWCGFGAAFVAWCCGIPAGVVQLDFASRRDAHWVARAYRRFRCKAGDFLSREPTMPRAVRVRSTNRFLLGGSPATLFRR